jgi:hypothetical protein
MLMVSSARGRVRPPHPAWQRQAGANLEAFRNWLKQVEDKAKSNKPR